MQVSTSLANPEAIRIVSFVSNQNSITIVVQASNYLVNVRKAKHGHQVCAAITG